MERKISPSRDENKTQSISGQAIVFASFFFLFQKLQNNFNEEEYNPVWTEFD